MPLLDTFTGVTPGADITGRTSDSGHTLTKRAGSKTIFGAPNGSSVRGEGDNGTALYVYGDYAFPTLYQSVKATILQRDPVVSWSHSRQAPPTG
jgi:hypothetical protein